MWTFDHPHIIVVLNGPAHSLDIKHYIDVRRCNLMISRPDQITSKWNFHFSSPRGGCHLIFYPKRIHTYYHCAQVDFFKCWYRTDSSRVHVCALCLWNLAKNTEIFRDVGSVFKVNSLVLEAVSLSLHHTSYCWQMWSWYIFELTLTQIEINI